MQSHIKIKLKFKCIIGILDFERHKSQKIVLKLEAKSKDFLDYAKLCKILKKSYKKQKFELLEESLDFIFAELKKLYPSLSYLKAKITKPKIIKKAKVSVCLEKSYE